MRRRSWRRRQLRDLPYRQIGGQNNRDQVENNSAFCIRLGAYYDCVMMDRTDLSSASHELQFATGVWCERKMKILIVDDDPSAVDFFVQVAKALDVPTPDTAESGEEAMARVVNGQYDLITLDIRMPGASGLEILSMVRNMCPHAIIALISAHFPEDVTEETAHCADVLLEKPVKLKVLTTLIEYARSIRSELDHIRTLNSFEQKKLAG